jgi:hypothetical protein
MGKVHHDLRGLVTLLKFGLSIHVMLTRVGIVRLGHMMPGYKGHGEPECANTLAIDLALAC